MENSYISMETGAKITQDESVVECKKLISRMNEAKKMKVSPSCIITWVTPWGNTSHSSITTLDEARALTGRQNMEIGDSWTDFTGTLNTVSPA